MAQSTFDLTGALPFDRDANDGAPAVLGASSEPFLYLGTGLPASAFTAYVASYNFGRIPPSYIVLHHTAIPSLLAARFPSGAVWDDGEQGMSEARVFQKRTKQLDQLRDYYRDTIGWDRGPHLFIDDRYIWLFTPMNAVGIHAKEGNSYTQGGKLHYSVGVEVIGYYETKPWPEKVAANVRAALQALSARLGIALKYTPGPPHAPSAHVGQLSSHRDYNKPGCPGRAITEAFYTATVQSPADDLFHLWGPIGKPTGAAMGFAVPRAWLVNKKLGACVVPETYSASGRYSVTEFQSGLIVYFKARNTTEVRMF